MGQQDRRPSLVEDPGTSISTELGSLTEAGQENWHGRRAGTLKGSEGIFRRVQMEGR